MHVQKNDTVIMLSGNQKGKTGKILKVFPKDKRILVEGVNLIKKHTKPSQKLPQGGIIEKEAPIQASNAKVICPKCSKPTRTGKKRLEDGLTLRYCKLCGEMIVQD